MKIQITQNITFPTNTNIPTIKQGSIINLPYKEETKDCILIMEYQDRSFFFNNYVSLYYNIDNQISGMPLNENQDYKILSNERGKISKLTQTEFELEEERQVSLFI